MTTKEEPKAKAANDIRIGMNTRVRNVILYSSSILKEKNLRELKFSAVGGSIGRLLDTVEVLKAIIPGFYQQNKITSVAYQTLDSNNTVLNQRLYPKMEVILSLDEFKTKNEGTQDKLKEEERTKIEKILNERKQQREGRPRRPGFRGGRRGFKVEEEEDLEEEEEEVLEVGIEDLEEEIEEIIEDLVQEEEPLKEEE